jgi:hypothetical protein
MILLFPHASRDTIESALARFSQLAGLTFFEVVLTHVQHELRVAAVNPYPHLEDFTLAARSEIVAALVLLLTVNQSPNFQRSCV